jgi:hypothetical protein
LAKRPRFHLHFTPTSASWINLVERWFAALTEKQIRRGVHRSLHQLEVTIKSYPLTNVRKSVAIGTFALGELPNSGLL